MTPVAVPPIRDRHQRCVDCGQWASHAVSVRRLSHEPDAERAGPPGAVRHVECLVCGSRSVSTLGEVATS